MSVNGKDVQEIIRRVARDVIMPRFKRLEQSDINRKDDSSFVTIADQEAEQGLTDELCALLPGSIVLGEESFKGPGCLDRFINHNAPVWIIDPIDGTHNFIQGKDYFGVMVALWNCDHLEAAWIYNPLRDLFISARRNQGAFLDSTPLRILEDEPLNRLSGVFYNRTVVETAFAQDTLDKPHFILPTLASCSEHARLVSADLYPSLGEDLARLHIFGITKATPWDIAAGALIHQEAGGYNAFWNGQPFSLSAFKDLYGHGFLSAPSKKSWQYIKDWTTENTDYEG